MKLRAKLGRENRLINLEGRDANSVTLEELQQLVASHYNISSQDFFLSLNKFDPIDLNGQTTLSDAGIVTGDLIHVVGPEINQTPISQPRPQPLGSHSNMSVDSVEPHVDARLHSESSISLSNGDQSHDSCPNDMTEKVENNASVDMADADSDASRQPNEINRYLAEPLVVRESTATQVPALLQQLFVSASCANSSDALWVVLHTLMLESGFTPHESAELTGMPAEWRRPGFYKCAYSLSGNTQHTGICTLAGVSVGTSVVVHGLSLRDSETFKTEQLQLKASDYVRILSQEAAETYRSLDRLSRHFKDTICLPLYNTMQAGAGCPLRQGLEGLPYEVKMRILSLLDVKSLCRIGQTCQELSQMYKEKTLWRRMYIQDFGKPDDCSLGRDWYELYKERLKKRREEEEERRRLHRLFEPDPFWGFPGTGPFRPVPGMPYPPHIIGGDYDLNPEFAAGGVPMGGRSRHPPNPIPPDLGLPSPLGGGIDGLGMLGGRRGRGNLTGSPFSSPFRGGPFM